MSGIRGLAALALLGSMGVAVGAQAQQGEKLPQISIQTRSANLVVGGQRGTGTLTLPNLGTNCAYPLKISSFGVGIKVGLSRVKAEGSVQNLQDIADLAGRYSVLQGETTVIVGGSQLTLKNRNNAVRMRLSASAKGVNLGAAFEGMTIAFATPMGNTPRPMPQRYVVYFGYNRIWVGDQGKATLQQVVRTWKCRYVAFEVIGHTDTTGKEGYNVELSDKRAKTVRDLLVKAGVNAERIATRAAGQGEPLVQTGQGVRTRANRAAVIIVK